MKSVSATAVVTDHSPLEDSEPSDIYLSAFEDPPLSDPENESPIAANEERLPPAVSVNGNANNSNLDDKDVQKFITSNSPYVAQVLADMPPLMQPPTDEELGHEDRGEEWERRRAWREEKLKQLNKDVQKAQSLLSEDTTHSEKGTENELTTDSLDDTTEQH